MCCSLLRALCPPDLPSTLFGPHPVFGFVRPPSCFSVLPSVLLARNQHNVLFVFLVYLSEVLLLLAPDINPTIVHFLCLEGIP